jgi:hypothetical protein
LVIDLEELRCSMNETAPAYENHRSI